VWLQVNLRLLLVVVWDGLGKRSAESWLVTAAGAGIGRIVRIGWHGRGPDGLKHANWQRTKRCGLRWRRNWYCAGLHSRSLGG